MCKLYVLGNGFDIANHVTEISYKAFFDYCFKMSKEKDIQYEKFRFVSNYLFNFLNSDVELYQTGNPKNNQSRLLLQYDKDCPWSDFESKLGQLDIEKILNFYKSTHKGDFDFFSCPLFPFSKNEKIEIEAEISSKAKDFVENEIKRKFQDCFNDWVNYIIPKIKPIKNKLFENEIIFNKNDVFLTFNYTKILEDLFCIGKSNIVHIHGMYGCNEDYIIGHNTEYSFYNITNNSLLPSFLVKVSQNLTDTFSKKAKSRLQQHNFFDNLKKNNIKSIVFFGFSFGMSDGDYIMQIFNYAAEARIPIEIYSYKHNPIFDASLHCMLHYFLRERAKGTTYCYSVEYSNFVNSTSLNDYTLIKIDIKQLVKF